MELDSGRRQGKVGGGCFSAERRGFSAPSAANWTAVRLIEGRPAIAGQTRVFARHRNVLSSLWIPSKRENHAGQSLYVPLPGFRCRLMGLPDA